MFYIFLLSVDTAGKQRPIIAINLKNATNNGAINNLPDREI